MKARLLLISVVVFALALSSVGAVGAQGPQPPRGVSQAEPPAPPPGPEWEGKPFPGGSAPLVRLAGEGPEVRAATIPLGQPGLSFRYVQTFGVTEEPYISTTTHLNYPYGVGAQGNSIWIGELIGRRALKYNADGTNLAVIGRAGWADHPNFVIWSVFDVAADSSGNVWVVDGQAHHVLQFNASGNYVKELGKAWEEGTTNDRFGCPNSIAFDSQGNIYVSDGSDWWNADWGNQRIQVFDSSGNYKATLGTPGTAGQGNNQFYGPAHIAIYSDYLYVADRGNHRVQIYQIQHSPSFILTYVATLGVTGQSGDDNNHFNNPSGVAVDANYIYVADTFNHRVQVFYRGTRSYATTIGSHGSANGQFDQPYDIAVDASGYLYVADFWNSRVQQFRPAGTRIWNWQYTYGVTGVPYVTDNAHFFHPEGVAIGTDGSIYIAENYGRRLVKLAADGTPQWSHPSVPGLLGYTPNDVAIGKDGRVYVAAGWENRIRIYNPDGTLYSSFGGYGNGNYQFDDPRGIGVAPNGDVYIADCWNHRVQAYGPDWAYKATMGVNGQSGDDNSRFNCPTDVAIDSTGTIYIADEGNNRVQVFNSNRQYVRTIGGEDTGNAFDRFSGWGPHRLAVDDQNRLYVADSGNDRVQVFDNTGAYLTTIGGSWGNRTGQLRGPFGVAIGPDGSVYVADRGNHRIQKFAPGVPGWKQVNINGFGDPNNRVTTLAPFGGHLYAGTYNFGANGAQLWRMDAAGAWAPVMTDGFGDAANVGIDHLIEFNSQLYAGVWNEIETSPNTLGGEIWRSGDGVNWSQVVDDGFGDPTNGEVMRLGVFNGQIYAGTWSYTTTHGAEIWRSSTGNPGDWQQVVDNGLGDATNRAILTMEEFSGALYAGTYRSGGCEVWRTTDGANWARVVADGFGIPNCYATMSLAGFGAHLYAGLSIWDPTSRTYSPAQIWRCSAASGCDEAADWEQVIPDGLGNPRNYGVYNLSVFGGHLYAITFNSQMGIEVWRTADGTHWEQVGFAGLGDSNNRGVYWDNGVAVFNNRLFVGTTNSANGGEIWKKTVTAGFSANPTVGAPGTAVTFTNLAGGDGITATWDFGDGSPPLASNAPTVQHTYTAPGTYTVTLTVSDGVDTDVKTRPAYIRIAHRLFLPLVMRDYSSSLMLYDDFNNPAFDGSYNPVKWQFLGDPNYFSARQQSGTMQIANTPGTPGEAGLDLPLAIPLERSLRQLRRFQARLKLSPDTNGTGAKIQIMAWDGTINGHGWWTQCSLNAYDGYPPDFGCDVHTYEGNTRTREYGVSWPTPLSFDTWYIARIDIDPDTAQVCFYLNDSQLGCHVPDDAVALQAATNLIPRIGSWNGRAGATGVRSFDDVYITPARP